jgi:hypothetical protein
MKAIVLAAGLIACMATGCAPAPRQADRKSEPVASATHAAVIPSRFRGEWRGPPADCGTGQRGSGLVLWADRMAFRESAGPVLSVTRHQNDEIGIAVALADERGRWTAHHRFRLSDDGRTLTDVGSGGQIRHRCE